ncbi:MAG TPA: hypothetical protein VLX29_01115 [Nitrospirota bacterium]|nr:hypothetical protein [Nitrospirota bacterium]
MGYFDGLADVSFKTDEQGKTIFYPWGIFGKGYIIPEDKKDRFRFTIKRYLQMCVPLTFVFSIFLNLLLFFFIILPLYFVIWVKTSTRGLATSSDKFTLAAATNKFARKYNWATFWFLEIISFLFILAGIFILGHILVGG